MQRPIYRVPCNIKFKTRTQIPFPPPPVPQDSRAEPCQHGEFGLGWFNPKLGGFREGDRMAGAGYDAQGRTQNMQGRLLQTFLSISGVGMKDALALG